MIANPYRKSVAAVIDDTLRICGDFRGKGRDGRRWTWSEVHDVMKYIVFRAVRDYGFLKRVAVVRLVAGQSVYDMPADCIRVLSATLFGFNGQAVLPGSVNDLDYMGQPVSQSGSVSTFYRDMLTDRQVGVYPAPGESGSTFTADSPDGLIREIVEGAAYLDNTGLPLRYVDGAVFLGDNGITRSVTDPSGNMVVCYIRVPEWPNNPHDGLEDGVPVWLDKDIKYGVAEFLLKSRPFPTALDSAKSVRFGHKWTAALMSAQHLSTRIGALEDVKPG